jgi:uncharacterized protein YcbK (DUF882 family)
MVNLRSLTGAFILLALLSMPAAALDGQTRGLNRHLVSLLWQIQNHFGSNLTVVSGCRSLAHNRRIGGARESWHLRCAAADVKVAGVDKGRVARFAGSLGGRGGLGSYCHDSSIHVDLGPRREWYWGCHGQRSFSQGAFHRGSKHIAYWRHRRHRR